MDAFGQRRADAGHGDELRDSGVLDAFASTEMSEQGLEFLGAEPLHALQRVGQTSSTASFAVEGVDEAVGFVASVNQHAACTVEHERVVAVAEDGLLALGKGR